MVDVTPRFQSLVLPILRDALPPEVHVTSWIEEVEKREFPAVLVRRIGGYRGSGLGYRLIDVSNVELTALSTRGLVEAEKLYAGALEALYKAAHDQIVVDGIGHINDVSELMGMTHYGSLYQDSWRMQGVVQIRIRSNNE